MRNLHFAGPRGHPSPRRSSHPNGILMFIAAFALVVLTPRILERAPHALVSSLLLLAVVAVTVALAISSFVFTRPRHVAVRRRVRR